MLTLALPSKHILSLALEPTSLGFGYIEEQLRHSASWTENSWILGRSTGRQPLFN